MIRRLARLAAVLAVVGYVADRLLAARRAGRPPEPIRSMVVVDAPIERVWEELVDVEGQPRWMTEMKTVRIATPGPLRVGTRAEADVRILGIGVSDPVEIVELSPPRRFAIRHEGLFTGGGVIELTPGADGSSTIVTWDETLVPPLLPDLGALLQRPVLGSIFQADLHRFREIVEEPATDGAAGSGAASAPAPVPPPTEPVTSR